MCGKLPDTIDGTRVQPIRAMGLRLHSNTDMFYGTRDDGIGNASESAGEVVLGVGEGGIKGIDSCILGFELTTCPVKTAELD